MAGNDNPQSNLPPSDKGVESQREGEGGASRTLSTAGVQAMKDSSIASPRSHNNESSQTVLIADNPYPNGEKLAFARAPSDRTQAEPKTPQEWEERERKEGHLLSTDRNTTAAREELMQDAITRLKDKPAELHKFMNNLASFEDRMQKDPKSVDGSPDAQATNTYKHLDTLFKSCDHIDPKLSPLSADDRIKVAEQVMSHAANPAEITQGQHPTCNVACVETYTYSRNPAEASRLVTEVSTHSSYEPTNQPHAPLWKDQVPIDHGSVAFHPAPGDSRDHASQIFQVTALNCYYKGMNMEMRQVTPDKNNPNDHGERLTNKLLPFVPQGNDLRISEQGMLDMAKSITNNDTTCLEYMTAKRVGLPTDSQQTFEQKLATAKQEGKLPIFLSVNEQSDPFFSDYLKTHNLPDQSAQDAINGHVIVITDYTPGQNGKPGSVSFHNTQQYDTNTHPNGSPYDHKGYPIPNIYNAAIGVPHKLGGH